MGDRCRWAVALALLVGLFLGSVSWWMWALMVRFVVFSR